MEVFVWRMLSYKNALLITCLIKELYVLKQKNIYDKMSKKRREISCYEFL